MKLADLHTLFLECNAVCTDTRKIKSNDLFFALKGDNYNGNSYADAAIKSGAKFAVIDEEQYNTSSKTILVEDVLKTLQELAAFHRNYLKTPIVALTGSNGKTTTKELINAVLSKKYNTTATIGNLNNHIGVPLTLLSMTKDTQIGIVEMGANHLKEIEFLCGIAHPDYGYITNFGKAHLEGFGGIQGVIEGKSEMYNYLTTNKKTIFVNLSDAIQKKKTKNTNRYTFGNKTENTDVSISFIEAQPFVKSLYNTLEIKSQLIGDYNFNNIAAAITIGHFFKVKDLDLKDAIENYIPSNNRSQIINQDSNKIILDAYNANPTSMQAALLNFEKQDGKKIAILGDMFELGNSAIEEHQTIANLAQSLDIDQIIFIGENFNLAETNTTKAIQFESFNTFTEGFNIKSIEDSTILIKGSRGMALERTLKFLP
ncbi:UDP-N-acetylmuramoyl-tripeptide--D-alanyl-D-alanine ligase [Algibacter amylolyticus]|uniref:UDP-N-acetylmuramoyl-tripeptide--D-alanyl-D-alanine ligase n=1 Tax=Algibacter amylolyticus TaxID=1608400 RepID=A0A5M7BLN1_9FLAO|nr:UDP-N-acetylmuramoyl-tripeptide--D-alanyl-D-alanine ligase [Algibacter amylolyticus]KAA5828081.1 UDP-N-acetylmuramoyl-tripeptide--D-alanyl-D-alanine ligase [Algibacter amylolyticus]MBB5267329.1 UDP-N-acetylmuramoyl-tripeptide--D-alanyl-D-alanine ligase [Algibacter amylolyticus]TSJ82326.1 UDP-N-acetylmuramoyl-tripeptide--D-alanyl-D-alanine ligase [Algibacter amylolyticus]